MPFRYDGVQNRSWTAVPDCQRLVGMGKYNGKNVVITGGSSGLGLATAQLLVDEGARVLVTGRTRETLDDAGRRLGDNALTVQSDSGISAEIDELAGRVKAEFSTVDALFVNAGIGSYDRFDVVTEQTYDEVFTINAKGPYFTVQKLAPLLAEGSGVVLTTSIVNVLAYDAVSVYSASKAALRSMARTLARELLPRKIRVNAVSPGPIDTGKLEKELPAERAAGLKAEFAASNPMLRFGRPEEFARAAVFMAFDATFTTGAELAVDGGHSQL